MQYRHFGMTEEGRLVHLVYNFKGQKIKDTFYSKVRIQPQKWYHVVLTGKLDYGKGIINLFINGRKEASEPVINTCAPKFRWHLYLGSAPEIGKVAHMDSLDGAIEEIAEYNRALSPQEIMQLYLSSQ